eukprot:TRINITY_DN11543_c0_g1_i1.p1 TRINITY_DN11543_c0_g1~~TRINITY_DN11543_c0_g1_i1.p1  ORF type:complete len:701 (+),score=79.88 TRINITY_DN11543_c0_g1_i1:92-2194(+)
MQLGFVRVASRRLARRFRARQTTIPRCNTELRFESSQRRSIIEISLNEKPPSSPQTSQDQYDTSDVLHKPLFVDQKRLLLGKLKWSLFAENFDQATTHLASLVDLARQNGQKLDLIILKAFTTPGITDANAQLHAETVLSLPDDVLSDELRAKFVDSLFGSITHRRMSVTTVRHLATEVIPKFYPKWRKNHYYYAADLFSRCSEPNDLRPGMATDEIQRLYTSEASINELYTLVAQLVVRTPHAHLYYANFRFYATNGKNIDFWLSSLARVVVPAVLVHTPPRVFFLPNSRKVLENMYRDFKNYGDPRHEPLFHAAYDDLPTAFDSLMRLQKGGNIPDSVFIGLLNYATYRGNWTVHSDILREWQAAKFSGGMFFDLPIEYITHAVQDRFMAAGAAESAKTLEKLFQNRRDAFSNPATASLPFFKLIHLLCRHGAVKTALDVYNRWLKLPRHEFEATPGATSCYPPLIAQCIQQGKPEIALELAKQAQEFVVVDYGVDMINALILVWRKRGSFGNVWKYGVELSKSYLATCSLTEVNATLTSILKAFSDDAKQFPKAQAAWNEFVVNRHVLPDAITLSTYMHLLATRVSAMEALNFIKPHLEKPTGIPIVFAQSIAAIVRKASNQYFGKTEWEHPELGKRSKGPGNKNLTFQEKERFMKDFSLWYEYISQRESRRANPSPKNQHPQALSGEEDYRTANLH